MDHNTFSCSYQIYMEVNCFDIFVELLVFLRELKEVFMLGEPFKNFSPWIYEQWMIILPKNMQK